MRDPKWSAGEWEIDPDYPTDIRIAATRELIGTAYEMLSDDPEEPIANARAMAAAKDLYAACAALIEGKVQTGGAAVHPSGRFCTVCGVNSEQFVHATGCPVDLGEKAIARARGGAL